MGSSTPLLVVLLVVLLLVLVVVLLVVIVVLVVVLLAMLLVVLLGRTRTWGANWVCDVILVLNVTSGGLGYELGSA